MIEKWSAGYSLLKMYVNFAMWLSHKRIVVNGQENIPNDQAFIFAPNHQNALLDPLAIICTSDTQPVWLARADIFKIKFVANILRFFKILPVYRIRDGKENLSRNENIFDEAVRILENKKIVGLFPEAAHSGRRQMITHKKAVPRIAFIAEEKNNFQLNLLILPVGIYYSHYWKLHRTIIVNYGEPIHVNKFKNSYLESPQKAMVELRDQIYTSLDKLTINIKSEYYEEYEFILESYSELYARDKNFEKDKMLNLFYAKKDLIDKLESLRSESASVFQKLIDNVNSYRDSLIKNNITLKEITQHDKTTLIILFLKLILALISLPIFILSSVFNFLPYYIPRSIIHSKVKDHAFISTFNFVISIIVFPLYYLILFIIASIITGDICMPLISIICLPLIGKWSLGLMSYYSGIINPFAYRIKRIKKRKKILQLESTKEKFLNLLHKIFN